MSKKGFLGRLLLIVVGVVLLYNAWIFAQLWWWIDHNPRSSAFMSARLELMQKDNPDATLKQEWVAYERISSNLKQAVVAAEDSTFMQHSGFDWAGIRVAYEKNIKKGKLVAGGSTISQQLAKNLFLSSARTPWRKAEEAVITVMMEAIMPKRRILEIYLNMIEWGDGVFGAEAASRHYFGKSARHLSPYQAAKLAAIVPLPRTYDKHRNDRRIKRKISTIQKRMYQVRVPR